MVNRVRGGGSNEGEAVDDVVRTDEAGPIDRRRDPVVFTPPRPGMWELETTHHGLRPLTPIVRDAYARGFEAGARVLCETNGLPLETVDAELVHGCFYVRPKGLGEGDKPQAAPPKFVMKLIARLHPAMRRRNRTAAEVWATKRWRSEVDEWFADRPVLVERNLELQSVDLTALDDAALSAEIDVLIAHFEAQARRNLATHGGDLLPTGDLLAHCERWGISAVETGVLLKGSSPATVETANLLAPVAHALREGSETPQSIEAVRSLGDDVRDAVDRWERLHGWRLVTSDDVDRPVLSEMPALQLAALLAAVDPDDVSASSADEVAALRDRVPPDDLSLFDELVVEARYGMRQREDIRGICWNWSGGLLRRGLMEVGRRLVERGDLHSTEHVVELFPDELSQLLLTRSGPSADELAQRADLRDHIESMPPPRVLGEPEEPPPLDALPGPMARATAALMANLGADVTPPDAGALCGVGIGSDVYRGRARVVRDANDALERLEPGDVMIAAFTGPSFNSIVPMLGALVVEEGGAFCHAAIVAREFGLPAVIGAQDAVSLIADGAQVEVDPLSGTVRAV
jgi:pyruvate,water dikinase